MVRGGGGQVSNLKYSWQERLLSRKEIIMARINWGTSFAEGLAKAKAESKLVFADFFNPN